MTTKFIHFTIEGLPWMLNVNQVIYFKYTQGPGLYTHRIVYKITGETSHNIIFYSKTMEALVKVYQEIMKFICNPDLAMMVIKEADGDLLKTELAESRRLEEL